MSWESEMAEKLATCNPVEDLGNEEAMAVFMAEAFETNNATCIAHAFGIVARAKGMAHARAFRRISASGR